MSKTNHITGPHWVQREVQTIAGEIAHAPLSQKKYVFLSKKLDHALAAIKGLEAEGKTNNLFIKAQTEQLKEQVVRLYGDLEKNLVQREVSQIREESLSLKLKPTAQRVKQLERHVNDLEKNHLTLAPDRRIISDAKQALAEAKARLTGQPVVRHFDFIAEQKIQIRFVEESSTLQEDVEELFDIARAVYNRDFRQAKGRFATLQNEYKRKFEEHMQNLLAIPFEDATETMQALIAIANELVENGQGYPSSEEIDHLFLGLARESAQERGEDKIVSFLSKEATAG